MIAFPLMEPVRLLICEDEGIVALDLEQRLKNLGYDVVGTAPEGEQAFALAKRFRPDCVLMDIELAGDMPGTEAAAVIHQKLDIPSIYLTGCFAPETVKEAQLAKPVGYLVKPVNDRDLGIAIEIGLTQHRTRLALKKEIEETAKIVKSTRARLKEVSSKLKDNSRMNGLQEIINGIRHHFNNSLQGLVGSLDLLERQGSLPEAELEVVRCTMRACESHENFIRRLTWASGQASLRLKSHLMQDVLLKNLTDLMETLPRGITLETNFPDEPIDVAMDEEALMHAVRNIVMNAVEASPRSALISVSLSEALYESVPVPDSNIKAGWFCVLTVTDSGSGISPELMNNITDPFFSTRSSRIASGLGLTEAYGIAAAHGGWLSVESKFGAGTSVHIFLPLGHEAAS